MGRGSKQQRLQCLKRGEDMVTTKVTAYTVHVSSLNGPNPSGLVAMKGVP